MTPAQIQKVLRLIRSTGERVVVLDNDSNDVVVLMNLDEYEKLRGGRGVGAPLSGPRPSLENFPADSAPELESTAEDTDDFAIPHPSEEEQAPVPPVVAPPTGTKNLDFTANWAEHNAAGPVEEIGEVPEEPEEQFYLEPVE